MAEERQGEDPEDELVGVGRNRSARGDVEVLAEQSGEEFAETDIGRAEPTAGEVAGAEEAEGDESAQCRGQDHEVGQGVADEARAAGDFEPGEGVDRLLGVADGVEFGFVVRSAGGHLGGGCGRFVDVHASPLHGEFIRVRIEGGHMGGAAAFGQTIAPGVRAAQRRGRGGIRGQAEEGREGPAGGADVVAQQSGQHVLQLGEGEEAEQSEESGPGETEPVALFGADLEFRDRGQRRRSQLGGCGLGDAEFGSRSQDDSFAEVAQAPRVFDPTVGGAEDSGRGADALEFGGGDEHAGHVEAERLRLSVALALVDLSASDGVDPGSRRGGGDPGRDDA